MTANIEVAGLGSLDRLSHALREAGDQGKGLKRELRKKLTAETKVTRKEMRAAILPALPTRGGLAADVLRTTRFTSSVAVGSNPGVRIQARGRRSIRRMNRSGSFRHPVFGNSEVWVTQAPTVALKDFLDRPFEQAKPDLQRAVLSAITQVRANMDRSI